MKSPALSLKLSMIPYVAAAALGIPASLHAQTNGTWIGTAATGSWPTTTNWSGGTVATGAGAVADFSTLDFAATRTITLDGARTVGTLRFGDATTVTNDQVLNTGTAGPLTMDVASGKAQIENLNRVTTIGAVIAGNDGLNITNVNSTTAAAGVGGTVILGAANTFTGGLDIAGAIVQLNNNAAANGNAITLNSATPVTRILVNGGVTSNSAITLPGNVTGAAGFGPFQQTGTGLGTLSGALTINGSPSAGGHFVGGTVATNALVLNGLITSTVNLSHREGFVRYGGGGTGYTSLVVTNTAQVGATNGIATSATIHLGGSGNATLDLNGFDQTLAGLNLGYNGTAFTASIGTLNLGARTLTLNGDLQTSGLPANASHVINANTTGALNVGATPRTLTVGDSAILEDLVINGAALNGAGGITKAGAGTVSLNATTGNAPLALAAGGISIGRVGVAGTFSLPSLALADGTKLYADVGPGGDLANAGTLTTLGGTTQLIISQLGGAIAPGTYPFLNYTGASPGLAGFNLQPIAHASASLVDTGTALALLVTANSALTWDGTVSTDWSILPSGNWKLPSAAAADYIDGDEVIFPTTAASPSVVLGQNVAPSRVTFNNDLPTEYTVSTGATSFGITFGASLVKNGTGKVILRTSNPYLGATTLNAGTLELDHDSLGNTVLTGSSGVTLASGTTLMLTRDDGGFTFNRNLTGSGTVQINPHSIVGGVVAHTAILSGTNTGFSGLIQLLSPLSGTYRLGGATLLPATLGTAPIEVQNGAQLFTATNQTYNNPVTLTGTGFLDTGGNIGALRLEGGSNWAGPINISPAGARIGSHNATGTVSGPISGGDLSVNGSDGNINNAYTLIFTGTNSYGKTTIGGGSTATGVSSRRLNIGNGGTTGTLGSGVVEITGDGQNGVLGFDRSDGYTLAAGQTITAVTGTTGTAATLSRTFIDVDTLGAGLSQNGQAITLGLPTPAAGGDIRVAQARAGATFHTNGAITAQQLRVSTGVANGVLNINSGSVINLNYLSLGDVANGNATGNQAAGSIVNVTGQFRVGHFGTETSVYNMNGGTLTLTGASPTLTPSTAAGGGNAVVGDNNINNLPVAAMEGGGIYLGNDGTGVFNQNGGAVTTNWIVLDNRGNTGPAANMPTGIDAYNLAAGTLAIRSTWGILQRNASAAFNLGGGTILVDNTGTGTGTGANLTIPFDADIAVSGTGSTLNTNGAGNSFSIPRSIMGTGSLALTGGGIIRLAPTGSQLVTATLTGTATLQKEGTGSTQITGNLAGFSGAVNVTAGRLDLPASAAPASITLAAGASLSTEGATASLVLNGGTLLFDPNTPAALTATSMALGGAVLLDFANSPLADGTYTVLTYGSKSGVGSFAVTGAASYRNITVNDTGSAITVTLGGTKALTWLGSAAPGTAWDITTTSNWTGPDSFFLGDSALFNDTAVQTAIIVSPGVAPRSTRVSSDTNNFTFTTTGLGISGGGGLIKEGLSTLTLAGPNTYNGRTEVRGGTLAYNSSASLGSGVIGNSILIDGTGRLSYNAATALDLGINRDIAVGSTGGALSHNNATAAATTIPGRLSGSGPLSFHSAAAGAGTFILTGNNSGYTGDITVDAPAAVAGGLTALRIGNAAAAPAGGSITLRFPAAGVTGNATTLDLPAVSLPPAVTVNLTSNLATAALSLRSQVTSSGVSALNGPVTLAGSSIIQFSVAAGSTLTYNGNIGETTPGAFAESPLQTFSNVFFLRGSTTSTHILNGKVTLPSAGSTLSVTDGALAVLNVAGNEMKSAAAVFGTIRLGVNDAIVPTARLVIGQAGDQAATLDLNGFNQTVSGLEWAAPTGNLLTKGISNTHPTAFSTFTLNQATAPAAANFNGTISGRVNFIKEGAATTTLAAGASTFAGNVTVNAGTLVASGIGAAAGTAGSLGAANVPGKTIAVNNAGTVLSFTSNNIFGNAAANPDLPTVAVNGATLSSTRYNVLGPVTLSGGTLTQASTDGTGYEGYQFRGSVTVGGTAVSTIATTNGKANHLGPDTLFTVGDAVSGVATDLLVSTVLRNQSNDFGAAAGALTKAGPGTMELEAGSVYTGTTTVNAGTLRVSNTAGSSATGTGAVAVNGGSLAGVGFISGSVSVNNGGTLSPGTVTAAGTLTTGPTVLGTGAAMAWEVSDWNGAAGTGYDTVSATSLGITATPAAPAVIRISQLSLVNFSAVNKSFVLVTTTGGITGFDASAFIVDASGFSAGTGTWSVSQSGNNLQLDYNASGVSTPPYEDWATSKGLTGADRASTADPDLDGVINLTEFALNSEPKSGVDSGKMRVAVANFSGSNYLTLTLPVRSGIGFSGATEQSGTGSGVRYRIQGDNSLNLWTAPVSEVSPALSAGLPALDPGWTYRTFRITAPITGAAPLNYLRGKFEAVP